MIVRDCCVVPEVLPGLNEGRVGRAAGGVIEWPQG